MNYFDLQELADRELKRLPAPRAPRSLLPRVLAATAHAQPERPRYGWFGWSRAWQVASAAALVALAAAGWLVWPLPAILEIAAGPAATAPSGLTTVVRSASEGAAVVRVLWQVVLQPVATWFAVLAIALTLAGGLLWTALEHFALGGASQR